MTQYLPPNLLALFAPRDPLPYVPPLDKLPWEKKLQPYSGVAQFINEFEDPKDTPPPTRVETKEERKERKRKERAEQVAYKLEQDLALWVPGGDPHATSDPFKTLFVTRINYDTSESKLRREFEVYGPVRKIHLVTNQKAEGKPRGYAFIEYEHERDMHSAYKHADGKKLDGRRVLVDVERGRTIKGWRSRRLGGGLGGTRKGGPEVNTKYSGREDNIRDDRSRSGSPVRRRRRSLSRSRERPRRRSRSKDKDRREERRRSRDRTDRDRDRGDRDRGDRDRERERDRDRGEREETESSRKRSRRSRSREPRKRSRSRERKRSKRSRSRDRGVKRERDPDRDRREEKPKVDQLPITEPEESYIVLNPSQIKAEPVKEGYDKYANRGSAGSGGEEEYEEEEPGNGFNNGEAQEDRMEGGRGEYENFTDDK